MANENPQKSPTFLECKCCHYISCNKKDFSKHIATVKHFKLTNANKGLTHLSQNPKQIMYTCICKKSYSHMSSLCKHKKTCVDILNKIGPIHVYDEDVEILNNNSNCDISSDNSNIILEILKQNQTILLENQEFKEKILDKTTTDNKDSLIMELVKQNQEFKELMMEQNKYMLELAKTAGHNTNSHNTTNNKFNLQLFLNETCKDAMNITEFVNSLVLNFEDLENMGHLGYVEGICKIFLRGLRGVEVTKRPFHCSDVKRETMFVKDLAGWEKENSDNEKLTATIKRIAGKNFKQATAWMANHPKAVLETDSHPHMQYMKMMSQCLGGLTAAEDRSNYNKIIKRVAQEVLIDKGKD